MAVGIKKFNPGFLTDDEIVASFCVRNSELKSLLESLRASTGSSNVHTLVIGPRGSGKTHLLLRVAAEMRRERELSVFYPVVFAEESYEVATVGEFWLECLGRLAEYAPVGEQQDLRKSRDDLRATADDRDLADRCLAAILDFADRHEKRMVLFVENLNMLFADISDPDAGWRLRHTLQTEPRIILLGSATSRFDEIDRQDHALYDLFRVITLRPLGTEECAAMWQAISGSAIRSKGYGEIRPLEILTGGNPRLVAIISSAGASISFDELMVGLLELIDDHTEYFKGHLEVLPAQERRVYLALARLWKPATAREVADEIRLDTSLCSALLKRLVKRGAVSIEGGTPRRRRYYLAERLYNIYYLLRRGGRTSRLVEELINFMGSMYSPAELWDGVKRALYRNTAIAPTMPPEVTEILVVTMMDEAGALENAGQVDQALDAYNDIIERLDADGGTEVAHLAGLPLLGKIPLLDRLGRESEIIEVCDEVVDRFRGLEFSEMAACTSVALAAKAAILAMRQALPQALKVAEEAVSQADLVPSEYMPEVMNMAILAQAIALQSAGRTFEAVALVDRLSATFHHTPQQELADTVAAALAFKGQLPEQALKASEVTTLLSCLSLLDRVDPGSIEVLVRFSALTEAERVIELIEESGTVGLLFPLVTALQQEMGAKTRVPKEVDEVALDVRRRLAELRAGDQLESVTATAEFEGGSSH